VAELKIFIRDPFAAVLLDQDFRDLRHLTRVDVVRATMKNFFCPASLMIQGMKFESCWSERRRVDDVLGAFEPS